MSTAVCWKMFNNWLPRRRKALIYRTCLCPWCEHSHYGQFQATNMKTQSTYWAGKISPSTPTAWEFIVQLLCANYRTRNGEEIKEWIRNGSQRLQPYNWKQLEHNARWARAWEAVQQMMLANSESTSVWRDVWRFHHHESESWEARFQDCAEGLKWVL